MTRPIVTQLNCNVKSDRPWGTVLGRYNLIMGPNRSRKTAIAQGLELAVSGSVDDVGGKDEVKIAKKLLTLSSDGETLQASAEFANGHKSLFLLEAGSRAKTQGQFPNAMVHRVARDLLTASEAKTHRALMQLVVLEKSRDEIAELVPARSRAKYLDIMERTRKGSAGEAEAILAAAEYADKRARELSASSRTLKTVYEHLKGQAEAQVPNDDALAESTAQIATGSLTPQGHMAAVLRWAQDEGVTACPTCSSPVGAEHIGTCSAWAAQQPAVDSEALTTNIQQVRDQMNVAFRWEMLSQVEKLRGFEDREHQAYKNLRDDLDTLIGRLVTVSAASFFREVEKYLPDGWMLGLENGEIGLMRGDRVLSALSGAERAACVVAMACAASKRLLADDEPAILVMEDRAWDPKTLAEVMRMLVKFDGQVIIQTTMRPRGRISGDWTILETLDLFGEGAVQNLTPSQPETVSQLTAMQLKMLDVLGYDVDTVNELSVKSVEKILSAGIAASTIELKADGEFAQVA